jgi:hypothetical protein
LCIMDSGAGRVTSPAIRTSFEVPLAAPGGGFLLEGGWTGLRS